MVRPCGIFRDVYLTSKDTVEIRDFTVVTDLDENYENADLNVDVGTLPVRGVGVTSVPSAAYRFPSTV